MEQIEALLNWPYLIPTILTVVLLIAFVWWATRYHRRVDTFEDLAEELNFTLEQVNDEQTSHAILAPLSGLHVMNVATGREVRQRLVGQIEGFDVQVIDTIVGGWYPAYPKTALSHEQTHTLIVLRSDALALPPFAIKPKYVVADVFEGKPVSDVYLGPRFAKRHHLQTPDETAVRKVVTDAFVDAAATNRKLTLEARDDLLVAYRYGEALRTSTVEPGLRHCLQLADLLRQACRGSQAS